MVEIERNALDKDFNDFSRVVRAFHFSTLIKEEENTNNLTHSCKSIALKNIEYTF